jgi:uncharacterized protein YigA (DUF484 family)
LRRRSRTSNAIISSVQRLRPRGEPAKDRPRFRDTAEGIAARLELLRNQQKANAAQIDELKKKNQNLANEAAISRLAEANADLSKQIVVLQQQLLSAPLSTD